MPLRPVALTVAVAAIVAAPAPGVAAAAPAPASLRVERSTTLPSGGVSALGEGRSGAIDAVATRGSVEGPLSLARFSWPAKGSLSSIRTQVAPRASRVEQASVVLTGGGRALLASGAIVDRKRRIVATTFGGAGRPARSQVISPAGRSAQEPVAVSGGGAVAVTFYARNRATEKQPRLMLAFRAAGERRFATARAVDGPAGYGFVRYAAALGPEGDGAIVAAPVLTDTDEPLRIRRISARGQLGPWFPVADLRTSEATPALAVGRDGTIVVAALADLPAGTPDAGSGAVLATSLPPGGSAFTPVQSLYREAASALPAFDLTVAVGGRNETLVATSGSYPGERLLVFGGPAGQLRTLGSFSARQARFVATVAADGGGFVAWGGLFDDDGGATPVYAVHRRAGGELGAPKAIARTRSDPTKASTRIVPNLAIPLARGRMAVAISDTGGKGSSDRLLVLAP